MNKEEIKKPSFLKRVVAYLIDIIVVSLLSTAISLVFLDNTNYQQRTEQLIALTQKLSDNEITSEEYNKESSEINYFLSKESVDTTIVMASVSLIYYVVLCYYCHGVTLGKYLMKLRIVSSNDKELNMGNYLIRGLFVNLILSNIVSIVSVLTMNKDTFINVYPKISSVLTLYLLATMLFISYRNDGRGLHDLMSNTKVISTKEVKVNVEVADATIVEEKQIEEKNTKTTKKKSTKKEVKK